MTGVYLARDVREASALAELLLENGIDSYSQEMETGEYTKIENDFSVLGTRLFVEDADVRKAKTLIASEIARSKRENPNSELGCKSEQNVWQRLRLRLWHNPARASDHKEWENDYRWHVITGVLICVIVVMILFVARLL